ncbi:MAG: ribonuclease R [Azospirillum sp.]|nr:ribonuclease R [Azospirillum sp.]
MNSAPKKPVPFPTRQAVVDFIRESPTPVGKREIARAFHLTGDDRLRLKTLLKELEQDGAVARGRGRRLAPQAALPAVAVVVVTGVDADGEVLARPAQSPGPEINPTIYMQPERRGHPSLAAGDRVLARLRRMADGSYEGTTLRRLEDGPARILGVLRAGSGGYRLVPTERRAKTEFAVAPGAEGGASPGELVLTELVASQRLGLKQVRVVECLGDVMAPRAISLIAIHGHGLPTVFSREALAEAAAAPLPGLAGRVDLRSLPLVTIDGADARDFDDAVWAEPDAAVPGGWHLVVAIADVAFYVAPGSALDRAAFDRGNSAYFPDRVVPMLPEALSNHLCSLRPGEDRACLAAHLWIDGDGQLHRHRFERGLMRSVARLTYEQVQTARDGHPDALTRPLLEPVIAPLYAAFTVLEAARRRRGTLDLDLPERQIRLDDAGQVAAITERSRYDSHRLIEEFMIAANVAAAESLEAAGEPCVYRVHDRPSPEKLEALAEFLDSLGLGSPKGQVVKPSQFAQILKKTAGTPEYPLINEVILRTQAQAVYSPDNLGHFGLALRRYAHFTSPIRRYADLVVHRALIRAHRLGPGGLDDDGAARLTETAQHISITERRAAAAERDATDRYTAAFLSTRVGARFAGRIAGVTRFGLFVRLDDTGADGFIPVSTLPDDYYDHVAGQHALIGRRSGRSFRLSATVTVRLEEADPLVGSTLFSLGEAEAASPSGPDRKGRRHPLHRGRNSTKRGK